MKKAFGVDSKLVRSGGGIFDVKVDGELVYSKFDTGRFPDEGEVIASLKK